MVNVPQIKLYLMEKNSTVIPKLLLRLGLVIQRNPQLVIHATEPFDSLHARHHPIHIITLWEHNHGVIIFPFTINKGHNAAVGKNVHILKFSLLLPG